MEFFIAGLSFPPIWPKSWKILENIQYFVLSTGAAAIIGRLHQMTITPKSKGLKQK